MSEIVVTRLYLDEQIVQMQIVFGLVVIAFLLVWIAFVKTPGSDNKRSKK